MDPPPGKATRAGDRRASASDVCPGPDCEPKSSARLRQCASQDDIRRPGLGRADGRARSFKSKGSATTAETAPSSLDSASVVRYRVGDARARPAHSVRFASTAQASALLAELPLKSPLFVKRTSHAFTYAVLVSRTDGGNGGARLVVAMDRDGTRTKTLERKHWVSCLRLVNAGAINLQAHSDESSKETKEDGDQSTAVPRSIGHQSPQTETDITDTRLKLQTAIEYTISQISVFKSEANELTNEKQSLGTDTSCPTTSEKRKELDAEIQIKSYLVKQYSYTLKLHLEELKKVNGQHNDSSDDSSDEDSP